MTPTEIADILRQFNEWQQGRNTVLRPSLSELSEAIGGAVEMIERLEEAESDATEQARLNGMGASREAALMAKLEAAEMSDAESVAMYRKARDERDALRAAVRHEADCMEAAMAEIKSLRAKIEAMEKQEPVAWGATDETGTVIEALGMNQSRRFDTKLYLAPGAKGEEK